ncbi:mitochondrial F1-F0 ATP synthase subunit F of fungi-domain-containing protein [Gamsiella multidivaricata]|uniref:mitochondrial F1-F0 ATP synthase subunit F of fungi-domain-containing protein n=1 Tax=Gamsiella multidivaricata TaxID=101098 RepID=UPI002220AACA|nr:mitochondrial F1-F0 ATP synthase subunit F of fungi-domain-containing protein [Gamsiella multidivaricata]KAG0352497.1 ATP synthase f chain, mitochondrial precursor [Gamsiella multidivaricata]KAI7816125.1 mitochondrial F1-F0 ATP synthase subunit F of fungi-domain-containing protein [Gamsiella multidivaricata]
MNFGTVARRAYSTSRSAIPPTIGSTKAIGSPKDAARMAKVVRFYKGLPNGSAPTTRSTGYKARHFDGKNSDMTPVFQTMAVIFAISYTIDYQFHLKHHKNVAHH